MNIRITTQETSESHPGFAISDHAVAQLFMHGWEPPAGCSYDLAYWDPEQHATVKLKIPARTRQATAAPTHQQIVDTILARIEERMKLGGGLEGNFAHSYQKGIQDAAEAIQDLYGSNQ